MVDDKNKGGFPAEFLARFPAGNNDFSADLIATAKYVIRCINSGDTDFSDFADASESVAIALISIGEILHTRSRPYPHLRLRLLPQNSPRLHNVEV